MSYTLSYIFKLHHIQWTRHPSLITDGLFCTSHTTSGLVVDCQSNKVLSANFCFNHHDFIQLSLCSVFCYTTNKTIWGEPERAPHVHKVCEFCLSIRMFMAQKVTRVVLLV